jgi:hypothetical protein
MCYKKIKDTSTKTLEKIFNEQKPFECECIYNSKEYCDWCKTDKYHSDRYNNIENVFEKITYQNVDVIKMIKEDKV